MKWTYNNLSRAREAVNGLLTDLKLEAYLFAVEPRGDGCEVRVEYAALDGWKTTAFSVDDDSLLDSLSDREARGRLLQSFRENLTGAKNAEQAREARS